MTKSYRARLILLLLAGPALAFSACSDEDDEHVKLDTTIKPPFLDGGAERPPDAAGEEVLKDALGEFSLIDAPILPDGELVDSNKPDVDPGPPMTVSGHVERHKLGGTGASVADIERESKAGWKVSTVGLQPEISTTTSIDIDNTAAYKLLAVPGFLELELSATPLAVDTVPARSARFTAMAVKNNDFVLLLLQKALLQKIAAAGGVTLDMSKGTVLVYIADNLDIPVGGATVKIWDAQSKPAGGEVVYPTDNFTAGTATGGKYPVALIANLPLPAKGAAAYTVETIHATKKFSDQLVIPKANNVMFVAPD